MQKIRFFLLSLLFIVCSNYDGPEIVIDYEVSDLQFSISPENLTTLEITGQGFNPDEIFRVQLSTDSSFALNTFSLINLIVTTSDDSVKPETLKGSIRTDYVRLSPGDYFIRFVSKSSNEKKYGPFTILSNEDYLPYPVVSGTEKINNIINNVSGDMLQEYITALENFHTRHTNSDTVSETRGIGAARRWIFSKYLENVVNSPANVAVSYDEFVKEINGPEKLHKNVVYTQTGTEFPDRIFLVSGHMDSRNRDNGDAEGFAGGANDDGSGTAATIELARVLSQHTFRSTIILVAVTGEEQGLHGSRNLAEKFVRDGTNLEAMITLDVIGNSTARNGNVNDTSVRVFSVSPVNSKHRLFASYIKAQGEANSDNFTVNFIPARDRGGRSGDHLPFAQNGFTSARLTEPEDNMDHQHNK